MRGVTAATMRRSEVRLNSKRIGILTDEVCADFDEALDWIAGERLGHVEVRVVNGKNASDLGDEEVRDVRRQIEARGLYVSAIASPLFKCALDPSRPVASGDRFGQKEQSVEEHFAKLDRVIAIAKQLGAGRIRIFSFWREVEPQRYTEEIVGHLRRAGEVARRHEIQLLVENEPSCNGGFADEVAAIVEAVRSPAVKALWDPGNEAYGGREAFPAGYNKLRGVLAHVHLKDAYIGADGKPRCVPLGSGNVPWIPHFRALAADGYDGLFTIETHYTPEGGTRKTGAKMTLDALRAMIGEIRE